MSQIGDGRGTSRSNLAPRALERIGWPGSLRAHFRDDVVIGYVFQNRTRSE